MPFSNQSLGFIDLGEYPSRIEAGVFCSQAIVVLLKDVRRSQELLETALIESELRFCACRRKHHGLETPL